jgi:hypothetical protein
MDREIRIPKPPGMQVFSQRAIRGGSLMGCYVHDIPGRLRVRIPSIKGNPETAEDVRRILKAIEGIDSTAVNTVTGSVVINYNIKTLDSEKILSTLDQKGYFHRSQAITSDEYIQSTVSKVSGVVGKALIGLFLEKTFEGSMLSLLTVFI